MRHLFWGSAAAPVMSAGLMATSANAAPLTGHQSFAGQRLVENAHQHCERVCKGWAFKRHCKMVCHGHDHDHDHRHRH